MFCYALLMMVSYYILKTIREPLLLTGSSAEIKSYAYAATAGLLLFIVPLYGMVFRRTGKQQLTRYITLFFLANLLVFYFMGQTGVGIGFAYYVWVGIFSVMITAQFWAFAADSFNVKSGQRLFPVIMIGATIGGLLAPKLSGALFPTLGPWTLMLLAMGILALTLPCVGWSRRLIPSGSRSHVPQEGERKSGGILSGFALVFSDRYLLLLALLILLLNWVNTTGEYILAELVVRYADARIAAEPALLKADIIAGFYGNFFFTVNLLTMLFQVFLVARVMRWIGVNGAVLILPVIAVIGYGLIVFVPVFSVIRIIKILENSTDYSLQNTTRHALYLPLSAAKKYEGKTAIEAFFWRFGDLAQAGAIYAGLHWFGFGIAQFALVNMVLAFVWLGVAVAVSRNYTAREQAVSANHPPQLYHPPAEHYLQPGSAFCFQLPGDTFFDLDEGDVLTFSAHGDGDERLPDWLNFDSEILEFSGTTPRDAGAETVLILRATDFDGAWAEGSLVLRHFAAPG